MKCSNCNEKILKEDKFCGNCGAKIIRSQHNGPQGNKIKNTKENQKKIENKKTYSSVKSSKRNKSSNFKLNNSKKCTNCSSEISKDDRFCGICGEKINS